MSVQTSIARTFDRFGTTITLINGGASRTVVGFCVPMDTATINEYFDGNEAVGLIRPALTLYVAGTEPNPPVSSDTFFYTDLDAPSHGLVAVRKVVAFRLSGVIVLYLAACDG